MVSIEKIVITGENMRLDTTKSSFDMQEIENRRFMFNPQTGTHILVFQHYGVKLISSHAEEHGKMGIDEPFDNFVRGWVGVGREYKSGVIHFTPPLPQNSPNAIDKGFTTLEMFVRNGADENTIIRGFPGEWEQPLSKIISFERIKNLQNFSVMARKTIVGGKTDEKKLEAREDVLDNEIGMKKEVAFMANYKDLREKAMELEPLFFLDKESGEVREWYFNPENSHGGAIVENVYTSEDISKAAEDYGLADDFYSAIESESEQYYHDIDTDDFEELLDDLIAKQRNEQYTFIGADTDTMLELISYADEYIRRQSETFDWNDKIGDDFKLSNEPNGTS